MPIHAPSVNLETACKHMINKLKHIVAEHRC